MHYPCTIKTILYKYITLNIYKIEYKWYGVRKLTSSLANDIDVIDNSFEKDELFNVDYATGIRCYWITTTTYNKQGKLKKETLTLNGDIDTIYINAAGDFNGRDYNNMKDNFEDNAKAYKLISSEFFLRYKMYVNKPAYISRYSDITPKKNVKYELTMNALNQKMILKLYDFDEKDKNKSQIEQQLNNYDNSKRKHELQCLFQHSIWIPNIYTIFTKEGFAGELEEFDLKLFQKLLNNKDAEKRFQINSGEKNVIKNIVERELIYRSTQEN